MIAAKKNENHADCRRKKEQPILGKAIGVNQPIAIPNSNTILGMLVMSIEGCQIDV
jgi:hypothetical protein